MSPDTIVALYKQLAALGVPAFIVIAFYANYRGVWYWARDVQAKEIELKKERAKNVALEERYRLLDEEKNRYAMIAFANEKLAERSVGVARRAVRGA